MDPCFCISLLSTYSSRKMKINCALMILTPLNCYLLIEATVPDIIHVLCSSGAELCSARGLSGTEDAELHQCSGACSTQILLSVPCVTWGVLSVPCITWGVLSVPLCHLGGAQCPLCHLDQCV